MTEQRLIADRHDRSPNFDEVFAGVYQVACRIELLVDGQVEAAVANDGDSLPFSDGSVTEARSQFARQSLSITLTDEALKPLPGSLLSISGAELRVWSGALMPDNVEELLCMGTFGIQDIAWDYPFAGLPITGLSRGKRVMDGRFLYPAYYGKGSARYRLIQLLTEESPYSSVFFDPAVADYTIPESTYPRDRDTACTDLAAALGCEIAETMLGDFLVAPIPDVYATDVDIVIRAGAGGSLLTQQRGVSRGAVFNAIVATSANSDAPVSAAAYDLNPVSPTFWTADGSGFGHKPGYLDSQNLVSRSQCVIAANSQLQNFLGTATAVQFTALSNPAWHASDVAQLVFDDGTTEQHLLDSLTKPIGLGTTSGTTRVALTGSSVS